MMHWLIESVMPVCRQGEVKERERTKKEEEEGKKRRGK